MAIDSYRFLDFATRQIMKAWAMQDLCHLFLHPGDSTVSGLLGLRLLFPFG
jgi:hypothetical protein